jgi:hypothetical protein
MLVYLTKDGSVNLRKERIKLMLHVSEYLAVLAARGQPEAVKRKPHNVLRSFLFPCVCVCVCVCMCVCVRDG